MGEYPIRKRDLLSVLIVGIGAGFIAGYNRPVKVDLLDINGDGRQDIVVGGYASKRHVFLGQMNGKYIKPTLC